MGTASAESPNFGDERVIAACLELIEAGRPLSEILETAKTAKRQQVPCESERASDEQPIARTWRKRLRAQLLFWMILVAGATSIVTVLSNQAPAPVEAALPLASVPLPTAIAPSQGSGCQLAANHGSWRTGVRSLGPAMYPVLAISTNALLLPAINGLPCTSPSHTTRCF